MMIRAASVMPSATATVLRAFMVDLRVRWAAMGAGSAWLLGRGLSVPQARAARHQVRDVLSRELGQLVTVAGLTAHQQAQDEGAVLLEEEDVPRLLIVHVAADDSECRLVVAAARRSGHPRASPGRGFLHEPRDVVVEKGQRLLGLGPDRFRPRPRRLTRGDQPLDDEPVGRFEQEDVLHAALVEERSDGAEDLLEVLAGAALVDPHAVRSPPRLRTRRPGHGRV